MLESVALHTIESSFKTVIDRTNDPCTESYPAQFLDDNLELAGFNNPTRAIYQATKELFENAIDASRLKYERYQDEIPFLRVRLAYCEESRVVEIICTDTGTGIEACQTAHLCGGVFTSTKRGKNALQTYGKFGVGLKAAMLYSQKHLPPETVAMTLTTTLDSSSISYYEMSIDPNNAENRAKICKQHVFSISEFHKSFSGTEVRLKLPTKDIESLYNAVEMLKQYFYLFHYGNLNMRVEFSYDILNTKSGIVLNDTRDPCFKISEDFSINIENMAYWKSPVNESVSDNLEIIAGLVLPHSECSAKTNLKIQLLRFGNGIPVPNENDVFNCGISLGISDSDFWRSYGLSCSKGDSNIFPFFLQSIGFSNQLHKEEGVLVVVINVCSSRSEKLKFSNWSKSTLSDCYSDSIRKGFGEVLQELKEIHPGIFLSLHERKQNSLLNECIPLVSRAISEIGSRSNNPILLCDIKSIEDNNEMISIEYFLKECMCAIVTEPRKKCLKKATLQDNGTDDMDIS